MIKFQCSACAKRISAPDTAAGRQARCPSCKSVVQVPEAIVGEFEVVDDVEATGGFEIVEDNRPRPAQAITAKPLPKGDVPVFRASDDEDHRPVRRRSRDDDDDFDDDDDRPRHRRRRRDFGPHDGTPLGRGSYAICYNCGADAASRVGFTWWGGVFGPMILNHVSCDRCGTTYNGRSGKSNNTGIAIYVGVGFAIAGVLGVLAIVNAAMNG